MSETLTMDKLDLKEGAFYTYDPDSTHAKEGYAVAVRYNASDGLYLADTFWELSGRSSGMGWHFSEAELRTVKFLFDPTVTAEWRESTVNDNPAEYEPSDVQVITSQHGHRRTTWLRTDAEPSNRVKLANLNNEVVEAERAVKSAISQLTHIVGLRAVLIHEVMEQEKLRKAEEGREKN